MLYGNDYRNRETAHRLVITICLVTLYFYSKTWGNKHSFVWCSTRRFCMKTCARFIVAGDKLSIRALLWNNILYSCQRRVGQHTHTHTLSSVSTATTVRRTRQCVTLHVHCQFDEYELLIRNCKEFEYECICSNMWQECSQVKSRFFSNNIYTYDHKT
jgi:hypothetical protein